MSALSLPKVFGLLRDPVHHSKELVLHFYGHATTKTSWNPVVIAVSHDGNPRLC